MSEITPYPENLPAILPQELARFTPDGLIAMAMTGRAFDEAQEAGVIAIQSSCRKRSCYRVRC